MNLKSFARFAAPVAVLATVVASAMPAHAAGTPSNRGLGTNLDGFVYWSPQLPTIDQFKKAGGWFTQCSYPQDAGCKDFTNGASGWDTLEQSKMDVDANGWPNSLPNANDTNVKYRKVSALMFQGNGRIQAAGKYIVLYEGSGTIEYSMAGTKVAAESAPGRDVVSVTNNTDSGLLVSITKTDPANHLRNVRILPPGGVCSLDKNQFALTAADCSGKGLGDLIPFEKLTGAVWHPSFLAELRGFRTLRFMDWGQTNTNDLVAWVDRPKFNDAFWSGPYGTPVKAMVSLANEVGADPWINIPTHANDEYVSRMGRLIKSMIAPKLNVYIEYSNEPWNYGFAAASYMADKAAATWPDQIAKGVSKFTLQPSWYGMRSVQLCKLVKAEFGAEASRVKCVVNGQAASTWNGQQIMDCPYAANQVGGACYKSLDALAIAPYFGYYVGSKANRPTVQTWYTDADGGLSKVFQELLAEDDKGNKVTPPLYGKGDKESNINGAVAQSKGWMLANAKEAGARGLPLLAYEGGQHLVMYPGDTDQKWLDLLIAANRDPRMKTAYARTLADWVASGGQTYEVFQNVGRPTKYGAWGLKETQNQNVNAAYKWQAVLPYRDTTPCWWANCTR